MQKEKLKSSSIYIQAFIAMLIIQLVHKIVREIPGGFETVGPGAITTLFFSGMLILGIILTLLRHKSGLILGMICGIWMILQPIIVHIIMRKPDINEIWWYPVFPWVQAVLIIYFSFLIFRNENELSIDHK